MLRPMQHDPQFSEWLQTAKVGDFYTLEAHPANLPGVVKAAHQEAERNHVELRVDAKSDTEARVEVMYLDVFAKMDPKEHAQAILSMRRKPEPGRSLCEVKVRPGRKTELMQELQRLYSRLGYNVHDMPESRRGVFMLRWTARFAGVKAPPLQPVVLQSPDELEAKGLLRFDSADLKPEPSGPQDGAGEFSAGGRRDV